MPVNLPAHGGKASEAQTPRRRHSWGCATEGIGIEAPDEAAAARLVRRLESFRPDLDPDEDGWTVWLPDGPRPRDAEFLDVLRAVESWIAAEQLGATTIRVDERS